MMTRGDWTGARSGFQRALDAEPDPVRRSRISAMASASERGPSLPQRSPGLATTFSALVPGSGQMYSARPADGLRHLIVDGLLIASVVQLVRNDHIPGAILVGGLTLPFYVGNVVGAGRTARQFNGGKRLDLVVDAIEASER
jgi:hypothetical protein